MKKSIILFVISLITTGMVLAQTGPEQDITPDDVNDGALITQVGNNNNANIDQTGSHSAEIHQEGGDENNANIEQVGNNHSAFVNQYGDQNIADIQADGDDHFSVIVQEGNGHNVQFSIEGISNTVDIRQYGTSEHLVGSENSPVSSIKQAGDYNQFYSVQIGDGSGHSVTSLSGDDNIQQGNGNFIDVWQEGSNNSAGFIQIGNNHIANVEQYGNSNNAEVEQYEGVGGLLFLLEGGNSVPMNGSFVDILQDGDFNNAFSYQCGSGHVAYVDQDGNNSHATVVQYDKTCSGGAIR